MSNSILHMPSLVLNKSMQAIGTATVQKTIKSVCLGKARFLDVFTKSYALMDMKQWMSEPFYGETEFLNSASGKIKVPEIMVWTHYKGFRIKGVKLTRRNLWVRDEGCCQYCGRKPAKDEITIDHVIPQSRGGLTLWDNVALACFECNSKKDDRTPIEAGMRLHKAIIENGNKKIIYYDKPQKPKPHAAYSVPIAFRRESWKPFLPNVDERYWDTALLP